MSTRESSIALDSFSFRPESETYLARYNGEETAASMAVVATLAAVLDADPTETDQLYHSIDAEALDEVLSGPAAANADVRVEFAYENHTVAVTDTTVIAAPTCDGDHEHLETDDSMVP